MPTIYGTMSVKNGQKQAIMNLSNARQKTYAQVSSMTAEQKKGVIICPDYPDSAFLVQADEVGFDKTGTSLSSNDVEGAIKETAGVTYHQYLSNISVNTAWGSVFESGNNVPDFNVNGLNKRITVSFVPTSAASAIPFISAAGATRVAVTLVRGTSGTVSGDLYITVYD